MDWSSLFSSIYCGSPVANPGGALGASAPPAEPIVKNLNQSYFFSVNQRYPFVSSVGRLKSQLP